MICLPHYKSLKQCFNLISKLPNFTYGRRRQNYQKTIYFSDILEAPCSNLFVIFSFNQSQQQILPMNIANIFNSSIKHLKKELSLNFNMPVVWRLFQNLQTNTFSLELRKQFHLFLQLSRLKINKELTRPNNWHSL